MCPGRLESAALLGLSPNSKCQFNQIFLQHARSNFQRRKFSICCNILFCIVYCKPLSVFFLAQIPSFQLCWVLILIFDAVQYSRM